ncbi:hypothetical protein BJY04DRAFT_216334 [Aspergillus karnatakaensis]|uniref:uncharacterized protein n=1 Tax=Aspergillus karnatakaensis TaxID=1810916 RepID=UPI003CCD3E26
MSTLDESRKDISHDHLDRLAASLGLPPETSPADIVTHAMATIIKTREQLAPDVVPSPAQARKAQKEMDALRTEHDALKRAYEALEERHGKAQFADLRLAKAYRELDEKYQTAIQDIAHVDSILQNLLSGPGQIEGSSDVEHSAIEVTWKDYGLGLLKRVYNLVVVGFYLKRTDAGATQAQRNTPQLGADAEDTIKFKRH